MVVIALGWESTTYHGSFGLILMIFRLLRCVHVEAYRWRYAFISHHPNRTVGGGCSSAAQE